jgi:hypothetical protein
VGGAIFFVGLVFGAPILLAKVMIGVTWHIVLVSYLIWFGGLLLWGLSSAKKIDEGIGWAVIMGMFLSIFAIPSIAAALQLSGY